MIIQIIVKNRMPNIQVITFERFFGILNNMLIFRLNENARKICSFIVLELEIRKFGLILLGQKSFGIKI